VFFCVYLDEFLQRLHESGVGCYIGSVFVGALAYSDDIALLAITLSAMRRLLKLCDRFGAEFSVACVFVSRHVRLRNDLYYVGWGVKLYSLTRVHA